MSLSRKIIVFVIIVTILVTIDLSIKSWVEENWVRPYPEEGLSPEDLKENEWIIHFFENSAKEKFIVTEVVVIENFWSFFYIRNYNIGFSLLKFLENHFSPNSLAIFFKTLQLIAVIGIMIFFFYQKMRYLIPFTLIISGGLANVIDRFIRGYVVDYVKWYIPDSPIKIFNPWPIFNLADSLVSVGVVLLFVSFFFVKDDEQGDTEKIDQQDQKLYESNNGEEEPRHE